MKPSLRAEPREEELKMCLSELDMMVESILIAMEESGILCADGHWMTAEEVISLPEAEVIDLFNQIYGRD